VPIKARGPRFLRPGTGRNLSTRSGTKLRLKASGSDTLGAFSLLEFTDAPGRTVPVHAHTDAIEAFYVLEGDYRFQCGDLMFEARPGSFLIVPKGVRHGVSVGPTGGKTLTIFSPAGYEGFFRECADLLQAERLTLEAEQALHRKYGYERKVSKDPPASKGGPRRPPRSHKRTDDSPRLHD
jgi:quercetin dioxygenase-like cupin family protein